MKLKINPPLRGYDAQGSGAFDAPRGGTRKHKGIDLSCYKGSEVLSVCCGEVTKIGYPYNPSDEKKGHFRYVQVTDSNGFDVRYFYINPSVKVGDNISPGDVLGVSQGLTEIYEGITDHFHFEVKKNGVIINPHKYLDSL